MPKRILLIDSDESFSEGLAAAATAAGFRASTASDSEQGMALARQDNPDLIVVCVEAQPTNGYMLCTRLKKDDRLKAIPVILTSANATPDSFEKHKRLKTRAEDYLIKPFAPQDMLNKAAELLGMPPLVDGDAGTGDESLGLGDLVEGQDEPIQLGETEAAEAHSGNEEAIDVEELEELVEIDEEVEPEPEAPAGGDEDLDMFDQAFDALKPTNGAAPPTFASRPAELKRRPPQPGREPTELTAPTDDEMLGLTDDAELAIEPELAAAEPPPRAPERLRAGGGGRVSQLEEEVQKLKEEIAKREAAAKTLQQRADSLAAAAKKFERELTAAREEGKGGSKSEVARLQRELDKVREEVAALTEERDDVHRQLERAQSVAKQNEERAIKAYQKMKGDEKLREKTRKALQIALALLDDVTFSVDSESEKDSA